MPGRSFPVPDCEHVRVAKTYLGRSKFSKSTKQKIAACINRKAKALKCNVTKKAKAYTEYSYESLSDSEKASVHQTFWSNNWTVPNFHQG